MRIGPVVLERKQPGRSSITLQEVVDRYDIIDVRPTHMTVAERSYALAAPAQAPPSLREMGMSGATSYAGMIRQDYNPALRGYMGLRTYDEMRRSDGQVKAILRLVKTPVQAARWYIEPASDKKQDQTIAKFIWDNLTKWMTSSWPEFMTESLLMLDFGWYSFEKVFTFNDDGKVIWRKFAPRHPMDAQQWLYDDNGGPAGVEFLRNPASAEIVTIPISKLLVFTNEKEGGNMEGISVLRSAYKHWYYKDNLYKVDAIQKERHGIGIPIIKLPNGYRDEDKAIAEELGRNLRTNEKAHVVLPPMWEIMFAEIKGQPVDALKSVEHHDMEIAKAILAQFLNDPTNQKDSQELFLKSTRFIAETLRDVINKHAIPELVNYNWGTVDEYPELRVRRIGDTQDWRTFSFAIRNLIGAKAMIVDEPLRHWIREEMDLPKEDPETAVEQESPQNPAGARIGLPRQSKAEDMKQQAQGTGKANAGDDKSGEK